MNAKNADQGRNHHACGDIGPQAIDDGTNKRQRTIKHLADQPSARTLVRLKRRHHGIHHTLKHQHRSNERHKKSPANAGLGVHIKRGSLDVLQTSVVQLRVLLGDSLFVLLVLLAAVGEGHG